MSSSSRWPIARTSVTVRLVTRFALLLATCVLPVEALAEEPSSGPLAFAGCGSNGPATRLLVQAFAQKRPDVKIDVQPVGSTNGIWLAAAGAIHVGLVSRPLSESEKELGLTIVPYARTAVVVGVHPTVAADGVTTDELVGIYKGTKRRWGVGQDIVLLTREQGDSSIQVLSREIPGFRRAYADSERANRWEMMYSEGSMNRALAQTPFAIGLSDLGTLTVERLTIKALTINGISPTIENVASGRYPLVKTLAFAFRQAKLPPEAAAFLNFVKSPDGDSILRAHGYLSAQ